MSNDDTTLIILIGLLIVIALGTTVWMFARRRGIDHQGALKGTPRNPGQVKRENPPDR
jgi:hypothetical protein